MPEAIYTTPTEYDALETYELSRFVEIAQEYGRRAAAVLLASGATLGLVACEPGDQTIEIGRAVPEKVLSKQGTHIVTGLCAEQNYGQQKGHNCSPQDDKLKSQTVAQVRAASGSNTHSFKGVSSSRDCENPSAAFINSLSVGDVIAKQKENYRKFDENGKTVADEIYCVWEKR